MREIRSKSDYINKINVRLSNRKSLLEWTEKRLFPVLEKFDGKIYTIRMSRTINSELQKDIPVAFADLRTESPISFTDGGKVRMIIKYPYDRLRTEFDFIEFRLSFTYNGSMRFDYRSTIEDHSNRIFISNFCFESSELQDVINNYDELLLTTKEMVKMVKEYRNIPFSFKENIDLEYLQIL